jgi:Zn-dependent protease with chaperone function
LPSSEELTELMRKEQQQSCLPSPEVLEDFRTSILRDTLRVSSDPNNPLRDQLSRLATRQIQQKLSDYVIVNPEYQSTLEVALARLRQFRPGDTNDYRIAVIDDTYPQASMSPDGSILFSSGMMELLGNDPEMYLAILGHELSHLDNQDSFKEIVRAQAILNFLHIDSSSIPLEHLTTRAELELSKPENREFEKIYFATLKSEELVADNEGIRLALKAGASPEKILESYRAFFAYSDGVRNIEQRPFDPFYPDESSRLNSIRLQLEALQN